MRAMRHLVRKILVVATGLVLAGGAPADSLDVHASPHDTEPLQPGARVPSVFVETIDGDLVDLAGLVRESGALLVFFRGGW